MPELAGIFTTSELRPEQVDAFGRLQAALAGRSSPSIQREDLDWAAITSIALHSRDSAHLGRLQGNSSVLGWIGHMPQEGATPEADSIALEELSQHIVRPDDHYFCDLTPPFAGCLIDRTQRRVLLVSDPHGLHPIYYACNDRVFVFTTKLSALLRSGLIHWQPDRRAVVDFFTFEHVTGDRTFADNVKVLPPGTILTFEDGRSRLGSYRRTMQPDLGHAKSIREVAGCLHRRLSRAVARSLAGANRVAITLSGGMDSRVLLGLALEHGASIQAYTFGIAGCHDIVYARKVASACRTPHTVVNINGTYLTDWLEHGIEVTGGMVNCIHYHILALGDVLEREADVVLDGLSGDALTGGNLKWSMLWARNPDRVVATVYHRRATGWASERERSELFQPEFLLDVDYNPKEAVARHFNARHEQTFWKSSYNFDIKERQRRFIQYGPHLLRSLVAVETPFFGENFPELAASLPASQLMEQRAYEVMLSKHLPALAAIPDAGRGIPVSWSPPVRLAKKAIDVARRHLPGALGPVIRRGAAPATDYARWFRTDLRSFMSEHLLDGDAMFNGIIQRQTVQRLLDEHQDATADHSIKLGCLLTFAAWCRSMKASHRFEDVPPSP